MGVKMKYKDSNIYIMDGDYLKNNEPTVEAVTFYTTMIKSINKIKVFAAEALLAIYNENWLDAIIGKLNKKGFMKRLINPRITLNNKVGSAIIYFEDSDMFAGHSIEVMIEKGKPVSADIVGY